MKRLFYFISIFFCFSCTKNISSPSAADILMSHPWYYFSVHQITYDSNNNVNNLIEDSTYLSAPCDVKTYHYFLKDSIFNINSPCLLTRDGVGKWYLSADTILNAYTPVTVPGISQAFLIGFNNLHIFQLNNSEFIGRESVTTNVWNSTTGLHIFTTIKYLTYKNLSN